MGGVGVPSEQVPLRNCLPIGKKGTFFCISHVDLSLRAYGVP
jgi:hypothetical protein